MHTERSRTSTLALKVAHQSKKYTIPQAKIARAALVNGYVDELTKLSVAGVVNALKTLGTHAAVGIGYGEAKRIAKSALGKENDSSTLSQRVIGTAKGILPTVAMQGALGGKRYFNDLAKTPNYGETAKGELMLKGVQDVVGATFY